MPQWDSLAAFGRELAGFEGDLTQDELKKITRTMALAAKGITINAANRDLGGDDRFSGWPDRSLGDLRIKPSASGDAHWMYPTRKSAGPWKVAQIGRNRSVSKFGGATGNGGVALFQGPGVDRATGATFRTKTGKISARRRRGKRWSGYTQGKGTATKAAAEIQAKVPLIAAKAVLVVTRKRFTVT